MENTEAPLGDEKNPLSCRLCPLARAAVEQQEAIRRLMAQIEELQTERVTTRALLAGERLPGL